MFNNDFTPESEDQFRVVDPAETPDASAAPLGDEAVVSIDDTFTFDFTPAPAPDSGVTALATDTAPAADTSTAAPPAADAAGLPAPAPDAVQAVAVPHGDDATAVAPATVGDEAAVPADAADDGFASDIPDLPLAGLGFDFPAFI